VLPEALPPDATFNDAIERLVFLAKIDASMTATAMKPRVTSFAPRFLVDDLERSIGYYEKLGFTFGESWDGFHAIWHLEGLELHLMTKAADIGHRRGPPDGLR